MRGILVDLSPLRLDVGFRMLWTAQTLSAVGAHMARLAVPYQVFVLTDSTVAIGVLAAAQIIPIIPFSLLGGSLADSRDRRRILFVTTIGQLVTTLALAAQALAPEAALPVILILAFSATALSAMEQPARASMVPRLVAPERLPAAIALNQLAFQVASVVGPAVAGLLLATTGVAATYLLHAVLLGGAAAFLVRVPPAPVLVAPAQRGLDGIREALRFVRRERVILSTFAIDLNAMIFGMPTALFPVLALEVFHVGPIGVGVMAAAPGVGALLGAVLSGWVSGVRRQGLAIIIAVIVWGIGIVGFGLATASFAVALFMLAVAGGADVISAVFRSTIVQVVTPDELRGRVTSLHSLVVTTGPRLGDLEAAAVASVVGPQASVVLGGWMCIVGVFVVMRWFPELLRYRSDDPPASPVRVEPSGPGASATTGG